MLGSRCRVSVAKVRVAFSCDSAWGGVMRVLFRGRSGAGPRVLSRFPDCIFKSLSKKHRLIGAAALAATLSTPVLAADMGVPPTPPTPVYNWTEFYFGGNIGWATANTSWCS